MNNNTILIGLGAIIFVAIGAWIFTSDNVSQNTNQEPAAAVPQARTFEVALAHRSITPDIVSVTQGDEVTIRVTTDEAGEFHIAGYEIENDMEIEKPLEFSFTADKAGRYSFELHPKVAGEEHGTGEGEDIVIGAFVVNPR